MHRLELARATNRPAVAVQLTGAVGGAWTVGEGELEPVRVDAVELMLHLSGRPSVISAEGSALAGARFVASTCRTRGMLYRLIPRPYELWTAMPRFRVSRAALVGALLVGGCTSAPATPRPTATPSPTLGVAQAQPTLPAAATTVVEGTTAAQLALATSRALFGHSPAVVLAGESDAPSLDRAVKTAVDLGVPLLLTPATATPSAPASAAAPAPSGAGAASGLSAELSRLHAATIVAVGEPATTWARTASAELGDAVTVLPYSVDGASLPRLARGPALDDLLVLSLDQPIAAAAAATARASGARLVLTANPDPRASDSAIKQLAGASTSHVLAIGSAFGPAEQLRARVETAATGVQLPGGGQVVFPGRRLVALYGHPGDPRLGVLGEQAASAAVTRARQVAGAYSSLVNEPVVPAFEVIATVASGGAGPDGNYSSESSLAHLRPWVDVARDAGIYVLLDLQPGLTDFLTQAKLYTELLQQPHVGLALDPEWRLKPGQRHMQQIGTVTADEINKTATWLADLTRAHKLPQKVLMLHQFRLDMISNRSSLRTDFDELRIVIHADGFGSAGQKFNTWNALHVNAPPNVLWGWKNFYDEDTPTFTPKQTVAVTPSPVVVSYQ